MTAFLLVVLVVLVAANTVELAHQRSRLEDLEDESKERWHE